MHRPIKFLVEATANKNFLITSSKYIVRKEQFSLHIGAGNENSYAWTVKNLVTASKDFIKAPSVQPESNDLLEIKNFNLSSR